MTHWIPASVRNGGRLDWLSLGRRWGVFALLLVLLLLAPQFLSDFRLNQLGKFLTFAIVAVGLDLIWGYGGMMSLGQGLFFGLGAYGFAMYLKLQASGGDLPDFMFWSGLTELPWFWAPFQFPLLAVPAALLVPAAVAGLLGYLVFRSRVQGVYFAIITQALTLLVSIWFVGQQAYTGGTNGITNLGSARLFGLSLLSTEMQTAFYFATVLCLAAVYGLARWLTGSRFGRVLVALRDLEVMERDSQRMRGESPYILSNLRQGIGLPEIVAWLESCLASVPRRPVLFDGRLAFVSAAEHSAHVASHAPYG